MDSGGPTNFGIVAGDLAVFRHIPVYLISIDEIRDLTEDQARMIYKRLYWDYMRLDQVTDQGIATALLDTGVNRGIATAVKYAQRVCILLGHELLVDGGLGQKTLNAVNTCDRAKFITQLVDIDSRGYDSLICSHPDLEIYRKGWQARAERMLTLI